MLAIARDFLHQSAKKRRLSRHENLDDAFQNRLMTLGETGKFIDDGEDQELFYDGIERADV